jgi:hypothetical protein
MAVSQGARANHTGHAAEAVIAGILTGKGLEFRRQLRLCDSIFGTPIYTDFYLPSAPGFPEGLCIESKWQQTGGSVDEKLPYLVANIQERFPLPVIVVLHGGGYRPGAEAWLRRQVGGNLAGVYGLEGLLKWINSNW